MISMIPQEKRDAVVHGLREAFGVSGFEDIRAITKGQTTALVFRIIVGGSPYLLKIITRPYQMIGPDRLFTCMQVAADAGLAPHVRYKSVSDGIWITDFVEEAAFSEFEARSRMPVVLRALHALPPFPRTENHINTTCTFLMHAGPARDGFFRAFEGANIASKEEFEQLVAWHAELLGAYPADDEDAPDMVSSHNDLFKPDNILFDGGRVWLVDWEAAFLNDRYADLAAVANLVVNDEEQEQSFLAGYFGKPADEYQRARFFLMRQVTHMFYAMVFQLLGASTAGEEAEKTPSFEEFRRRLWAGEVDLVEKATKRIYGRVHWDQLVKNMRTSRYAEALRIGMSRKDAKPARV
jgi:thiamine kinase-like enzyme